MQSCKHAPTCACRKHYEYKKTIYDSKLTWKRLPEYSNKHPRGKIATDAHARARWVLVAPCVSLEFTSFGPPLAYTGSSDIVMTPDGKILAMTWMDVKSVACISTAHEPTQATVIRKPAKQKVRPYELQFHFCTFNKQVHHNCMCVPFITIQTDYKKQQKKMETALLERDDPFVSYRLEVTAPTALQAYNENMGGVDGFDQNRYGKYALDKTFKTRVWYRKLIIGLLGFAVTNAWLVWKHRYIGYCHACTHSVAVGVFVCVCMRERTSLSLYLCVCARTNLSLSLSLSLSLALALFV